MQWIERKSFAVYFYSFFLIFMVIRYFDELFLYQLISNPIRSPRVDLIVWLTHFTGIPDFITNQFVSFSFDIIVVVLPCIILYRLFKNKEINKLSGLLCSIFALYVLFIYCFPTLSIRKYFGLVLIPIAFIFTSKKRYYNYLELMRYYILFVFSSAALWKIIRGVAWDPRHMYLTLKAQHIDNFVNWPDHYITKLMATIMKHPSICSTLLLLGVAIQLSFIIGFFTKKYDKYLAFLMILFILSDYFVMRIEYWEFIVFLPLLLGKYPEDHNIDSSA